MKVGRCASQHKAGESVLVTEVGMVIARGARDKMQRLESATLHLDFVYKN
jgi:hypothetical protein